MTSWSRRSNLYDLFLATARAWRRPQGADGAALAGPGRCRRLAHASRSCSPRSRARRTCSARSGSRRRTASRPSWRRRCRSCRPLLLGAQVAGVASSLNYLLSRDAIFDLLNAEKATILVMPARELDETCWTKAAGRARARADADRMCSSSAASGEGAPAIVGLDEALARRAGATRSTSSRRRIATRSARCSIPAARRAARSWCSSRTATRSTPPSASRRCSATTSATSSSTAFRSSMSAGR